MSQSAIVRYQREKIHTRWAGDPMVEIAAHHWWIPDRQTNCKTGRQEDIIAGNVHFNKQRELLSQGFRQVVGKMTSYSKESLAIWGSLDANYQAGVSRTMSWTCWSSQTFFRNPDPRNGSRLRGTFLMLGFLQYLQEKDKSGYQLLNWSADQDEEHQ